MGSVTRGKEAAVLPGFQMTAHFAGDQVVGGQVVGNQVVGNQVVGNQVVGVQVAGYWKMPAVLLDIVFETFVVLRGHLFAVPQGHLFAVLRGHSLSVPWGHPFEDVAVP